MLVSGQNNTGLDGGALLEEDFVEGTRVGRGDLVLHLHRLDDEENLSGLDNLAWRGPHRRQPPLNRAGYAVYLGGYVGGALAGGALAGGRSCNDSRLPAAGGQVAEELHPKTLAVHLNGDAARLNSLL